MIARSLLVGALVIFAFLPALAQSGDIEVRVREIIVEHLGVDEERVTTGASFFRDLGADRLDEVELVMAFEEEFGCCDL